LLVDAISSLGAPAVRLRPGIGRLAELGGSQPKLTLPRRRRRRLPPARTASDAEVRTFIENRG
jgi:hypothetical protein